MAFKRILRELKVLCPDAILDGLVRVDIMNCHDGRLVVNEFESLEAQYSRGCGRSTKEEAISQSLQSYWERQIDRCYDLALSKKPCAINVFIGIGWMWKPTSASNGIKKRKAEPLTMEGDVDRLNILAAAAAATTIEPTVQERDADRLNIVAANNDAICISICPVSPALQMTYNIHPNHIDMTLTGDPRQVRELFHTFAKICGHRPFVVDCVEVDCTSRNIGTYGRSLQCHSLCFAYEFAKQYPDSISKDLRIALRFDGVWSNDKWREVFDHDKDNYDDFQQCDHKLYNANSISKVCLNSMWRNTGVETFRAIHIRQMSADTHKSVLSEAFAAMKP